MEASIIEMILNASLMVQLVMLILLLMSFLSWGLIFRKYIELRRAGRDADDLEDRFWNQGDLGRLYQDITATDYTPVGMENIFEAGYTEFTRLRKQIGMDPTAVIEGATRLMRVALQREAAYLERSVSLLATIGSVSPYIGLFGTVWGIMHAFNALSSVEQVTISMIAPGISEALIATAMGLFAAIPAVIAYNMYVNNIERIVTRYETFLDEFAGVIHRQAHTPPPAKETVTA
ncbi:MAG: protein TolQ [Pseudomonadota bacterium]